MAYCGNCGNFIEDGSNYCSQCGVKVENASNVATATAVPDENANSNFNSSASQEERYNPSDIEESKIYAALAYLGILFFLPLVVVPNSKFGRYHANQGLLLLIGSSLLCAVSRILHAVIQIIFKSPIVLYGLDTGLTSLSGLGLVLSTLITIIVTAIIIFYVVIGIMNAVNGKAKPLPIIGEITLIR